MKTISQLAVLLVMLFGCWWFLGFFIGVGHSGYQTAMRLFGA